MCAQAIFVGGVASSNSASRVTVQRTMRTDNLPAFFAWHFLGREAEWAAAVRLLAVGRKRVVTLLGPSGIGKTALAVAAAT